MFTTRHGLAALMLLASAHGTTARAAESYDGCAGFIETLPATITTQGTWCLKHDVSTAVITGNAITIATNNVTLDCNDFKVGGLAAGPNTATVGVAATSKLNVTVRQCGIRGFYRGIFLNGGGGHLVEDNRIDLSTNRGISLAGDGLTIRRNRVVDTGGAPSSTQTIAISVSGSASITENIVDGVTVTGGFDGNGQAFGIDLSNGPYDVVRNFINNLVPAGTGDARGIWSGSQPANISGNTIINAVTVNGAGVDGNTHSACRENTVSRFSTAITSCSVEAGNLSF